MNIIKLIEEHEKNLLCKIANLETQVETLKAENEKLQRVREIKHDGFVNFLLGKIQCPEGLEFDGRSFASDLHALLIIVATHRAEGKQIRDIDNGYRLVPWFPNEGFCHRWLDKETGFINCQSTTRKMNEEELTIHLEQRTKWIDALLVEYKKIM